MILDDFLPYILPRAKGAGEDVAAFNARLAIIQLCTEALIWREFQDAITTVAEQTSYPYLPGADQQVVKLLSLELDGTDIPVLDPVRGRLYDRQGETTSYAYGKFAGFEIRPAQDAGLSIVTYSVVAPSIDAEDIPDDMGRYIEQIARGALWRIYDTSGRDASDKQAAVLMRQQWDDDIAKAKGDALAGFARTTPRTTPRFF